MTAATSTEHDVELDQDTKDELAPPCEMGVFSPYTNRVVQRCDNPAHDVLRTTCTCGLGVHLACTGHTIQASNGGLWCVQCQVDMLVISVEPI